MNHDNVVYIQERLDGNYWVWADRYDIEAPAPDPSRDTSYCFNDLDKAWAYAEGLYYGLGQHQTIEHGIRRLDPEQEKQAFTLPANFSKTALCCPVCDHVLHIELRARQQAE